MHKIAYGDGGREPTPTTYTVLCNLLRPLIKIIFLLVPYGCTMQKKQKRIPKEMTVLLTVSNHILAAKISAEAALKPQPSPDTRQPEARWTFPKIRGS